MLKLVSMTLTLMQGHSGSPEAKIQCWIISTTKPATRIKLAPTVGHCLRDLDFANVYMAWPTCFVCDKINTFQTKKHSAVHSSQILFNIDIWFICACECLLAFLSYVYACLCVFVHPHACLRCGWWVCVCVCVWSEGVMCVGAWVVVCAHVRLCGCFCILYVPGCVCVRLCVCNNYFTSHITHSRYRFIGGGCKLDLSMGVCRGATLDVLQLWLTGS